MFKRVQSRDALIEYSLRQLGAPVIQINVAQEQLEDRVNDALHMFFRYHMDATTHDVLTLQVTKEDIERQRIKCPPEVISVIDVAYKPNNSSVGSTINNLQYQMYFSDLISRSFMGSSGLSNYTITKSYLSMLSQTMGDIYHITDFNLHTNEVKIFYDWSKLKEGDLIGLEVYKIVNPEEYVDVWDNYWLKEYTTALIKKQWGTNLMKYTGTSLIGGGQINGDAIYNTALEDIQKLEDRLVSEFQYPVMGFMG